MPTAASKTSATNIIFLLWKMRLLLGAVSEFHYASGGTRAGVRGVLMLREILQQVQPIVESQEIVLTIVK